MTEKPEIPAKPKLSNANLINLSDGEKSDDSSKNSKSNKFMESIDEKFSSVFAGSSTSSKKSNEEEK